MSGFFNGVGDFFQHNIIDPVKNKINVFNSDVLDNWIESNFRQYLTNYSYNDLVSNNKTDILDGFINCKLLGFVFR